MVTVCEVILLCVGVASIVIDCVMVTYSTEYMNISNSTCTIIDSTSTVITMASWANKIGVAQLVLDILPAGFTILVIVSTCAAICCTVCGAVSSDIFAILYLISLIASMICDVVSAVYGIIVLTAVSLLCQYDQRAFFIIICIYTCWHGLTIARIGLYVGHYRKVKKDSLV
jgi:hypothetical protein